jgi:hypothetical protein
VAILTLGEIAGLVTASGTVPYVWQVVFQGVRPERASWLIWFALGVMSLVSQRSAGGVDSLWLTVGQDVATGLILVLSIFKGEGGLSLFDLRALAVASVGIVGWRLSGDAAWGVVFVIVADSMGVVTTMRKTLADPSSESWIAFLIAAVAATLGSLAVHRLDLTLLAYPVYLIIANAAIVMAVLLGNRRDNGSSPA